MKSKYLILFIVTIMVTTYKATAQTLTAHDFNNGSLGPFHECTTRSPNYARVVNGRLKTFWTESSYNGTRMTKGAEICGADWHTRKEGWMGFTMNLGPDYPMNKTASIAQIFQFYSTSFWTWAALINIVNGDLQITHRDNGGTSRNTDVVVYENFPKNRNMDIIIHFKLSHENKGVIQIWVNGVSQYFANNINFGFAEGWQNDRQTSQHSYVDLKIGQYNYDNTNYTNGETRTVYYDNVKWYNGANGYSRVNPSGNSGQPSFQLVKRNASGFAMDGGSGGADGQSIELYNKINHPNLTWVEIDRGGGYYTYQKLNTNFCIDGGRGGTNGQDVYLWTCDDQNQNQHWLKVDLGNGHYRLQKRNAPDYSIDGGAGGAVNQNVYLWRSSNSNQNQHWWFDALSNAREASLQSDVPTLMDTDIIRVSPNPVANSLTIYNTASKYHKYSLLDMNGKIQQAGYLPDGNNAWEVDLSQLPKGVYVLSLTGVGHFEMVKLVKE